MKDGIDAFNLVLENFVPEIKLPLSKIPKNYKEGVEEIRLRVNSPLNIYYEGKDYFVSNEGEVSQNSKKGLQISLNEIYKTFQLTTNYSIYALSEEIKYGFITIRGGHRVGIGGKIIYGSSGIEGIKDISSLNFRIARQKIGISDHIIPDLLDERGNFYNTLIISPPQCGKTTLLRDIVRNLSNGDSEKKYRGFKIALVDERSEIAGVYNGIPQKDIGIRTDILDGCLKSHGIMMLIRAMSPEIIAVDEIGSVEDAKAIDEAVRAGINLIATVHGTDIENIRMRNGLKNFFQEKTFKRFIIMDNSMGVGTIKEIINADTYQNLWKGK